MLLGLKVHCASRLVFVRFMGEGEMTKNWLIDHLQILGGNINLICHMTSLISCNDFNRNFSLSSSFFTIDITRGRSCSPGSCFRSWFLFSS